MLRNFRHAVNLLTESNAARVKVGNQSYLLTRSRACFDTKLVRNYGKKDDTTLFKPVPIQPSTDDINVGAEITGSKLDKTELMKILNRFFQKRETRLMCIENGLDRKFKSQPR